MTSGTGTIPCCCSILLLLLSYLGQLPRPLLAISIDNDIIGEPDIECLDQEIRVWVKTRKYFQGRIYAKGKADDPECARDDFSSRRTKKVHFDLGLGRCGMKSLRSFDPRGMYYGITLVISFHPMFITKVDQAFHVKCFFEEANRGLTAELGVSMIPTTEVEARHGIPGCTYSIHRSSIDELDAGKAAGTAIQFAKVGDKVLHQWHCDDQMFGILINNCFVTDGVKQKVQVIDNRGCPLDPILITGIRYSADLQRAYAESQVFKFADRPGVWFFCQIQMCMKKDGMCDGITPPSCAASSRPKYKKKKILTGRRKGEGEEEEKGAEEGEETAESDGPTQPNSSNEQDNGAPAAVPRTGPSATGYDEGQGQAGGTAAPLAGERGPQSGVDYEGPSTVDYDQPLTTRPEYTTTARPPAGKKKEKQLENISPPASPYGAPSPIGYEESGEEAENEPAEEPVTAFGPGYAANQVGDGPFGVGRDPPGGPSPSSSYVPPSPLGRPLEQQQRRQELLSTEFETEDDLRRRPSPSTTHTPLVRPTPTTWPTTTSTTGIGTAAGNGPRKDYVDYEGDVTIPPHLTDLLANLQPEDINAESLQRMFKDSVADRRALLQGFDVLIRKMKEEEEGRKRRKDRGRGGDGAKTKRRKPGGSEQEGEGEEVGHGQGPGMARLPGQKLDTVKVSWESASRLARDSPISGQSAEAKETVPMPAQPVPTQWHAFRQSNSPNDPPMIAGQLLIYDLDETPPAIGQQKGGLLPVADCALTRHGLTLLGIGSASLALMLLLMALALFRMQNSGGRRRRTGNGGGSGRDTGMEGNCSGGSPNGSSRRKRGSCQLERRRMANSSSFSPGCR